MAENRADLLKYTAQESVLANADSLLDLSHRIHANPEIRFEETQSSKWVADALKAAGFSVSIGIADLPTAFIARFGTGSLNIGICAEYDALSGVGHACGHNIIAASAVGAAIALSKVASELDLTVTVLGTPGEEGGGGKIYMMQRGAFDGLHAALMVHPAPIERDAMATLANSRFIVEYTGKAAHAAAAPSRGINAASAFALAQVGIGVMREHLLPNDRVHGYIRHGGDAMNVIPERTEAEWCTRADSVEREQEVFRRTVDVFKGAAMMTGASLRISRTGPVYADLRTDDSMAAYWRQNMADLGRNSLPVQPSDGLASTDMGNVSYPIPSIHPLIAVESNGANIHEADFAKCVVSDSGDKAVVDGAVGLAWTVIDVASDTDLRSRLLSRTFRVADVSADSPWLGKAETDVITFTP